MFALSTAAQEILLMQLFQVKTSKTCGVILAMTAITLITTDVIKTAKSNMAKIVGAETLIMQINVMNTAEMEKTSLDGGAMMATMKAEMDVMYIVELKEVGFVLGEIQLLLTHVLKSVEMALIINTMNAMTAI